jgi:serine O-acetyltransferase
MSQPAEQRAVVDPIWSAMREEALRLSAEEPVMAAMLHNAVLAHGSLETALAARLADKLASSDLPALRLRPLFDESFAADAEIAASLRADIAAVHDRDPASRSLLKPLLFLKGYQALATHRSAHWFWMHDRRMLALHLQSRSAEVFGVDIHPAARFGRGVFIDHATGVVVGETAVVDDDVSMLQGVTLGGTGKETGDRHPKIRQGVLISAGAKVLGNIEIGAYAKIGAGSVVLENVPPGCTVAGVPAKLVGKCGSDNPARDMDHSLPATAPKRRGKNER